MKDVGVKFISSVLATLLILVGFITYKHFQKKSPLSHAVQIAIEFQCLQQFGGEVAEKGCQCFIGEVNKIAIENPNNFPIDQAFRDAANKCGLI